ncbi:MAG: TerB family tellurite resistance protein [Polaromonas sp.]
MLQAFKELFEAFTEPGSESPQAHTRALRLASAVLLVEVMRADPTLNAAEREAVMARLHKKFALSDEEAARLFELAELTARGASDFYQFTSRINESFTHAQKIAIIENMWQIAYSDAHLDANENQLISKIAGLLYVTQGEYIGAKMRAKEAAGLAS